MMRAALIGQIAVESGMMDGATVAAFLAEYDDSQSETPFEKWLAETGRIDARVAETLASMFQMLMFRCLKCHEKFTGETVPETREAGCPSCRSRALKRMVGQSGSSTTRKLSPQTRTQTASSHGPAKSGAGSKSNSESSATGQSRPFTKETLPQTLGHWQILDIAGQGGMGTVLRAQNPTIGRVAAIKLLHSTKESAIARFHQEAAISASLDHPNIVRIYDFGEYHQQPYLIMEWIEGVDLQQRVRANGPMRPQPFLRIARQMCDAFGYAHSKNIVHRDIKPANVMITAEGKIKVMDFGVAKLRHSTVRLTATGAIVGTPSYMAPEQVLGEAISPRTDIYSLGLTFFFLLTGTEAYQGAYHAVLAQQISDPLPSLQFHAPIVPNELDTLVQHMCAKRAKDRPRSMVEIIPILDAVAASLTESSSTHHLTQSAKTSTRSAPRLPNAGTVGHEHESSPQTGKIPEPPPARRFEVVGIPAILGIDEYAVLEVEIERRLQPHSRAVILDGSGAQNISSPGAYSLVRLSETLTERGIRLIVAELPGRLSVVFDMLGVKSKLEFARTLTDAKRRAEQ